MAITKKKGDEWISAQLLFLLLAFPRLLLGYVMKKITDNSSEAQSCLFLCPTCLKCSFFVSLVVHRPCRICSKRLLSFSQVQLRRACPSMCGYVRPTRFNYHFSVPFDKALGAVQTFPCSGQKCFFRILWIRY